MILTQAVMILSFSYRTLYPCVCDISEMCYVYQCANSIQECHCAVVVLDLVGADVLGNAARFALGHAGLPDGVQQRGLTVVYVPQNRHHRRARF